MPIRIISMKTIRLLTVLIFAATVLSSCGGKKDPEATSDPKATKSVTTPAAAPNEVIGIGRVEPEGELVPLSSIESGVVTKVYVKQGDVVKAGDLLLELDHDVLSAQIEQSHRRVLSQASRIKTDELSLKEAETRAVRQSQNVTRTENLVKTGAETGQTLFDQKTEFMLLDNAVKRWESVLETDRRQLRELEGDIMVLMAQLEQRSVKAPMNGTILTLKALLGSFVTPQVSFADFAPEGKRMVRCEIDELFADNVKIGQKAHITGVGSEEQLATGQVVYASEFLKRKSLFSENAGEMEDRRVREIRVLLDSGSNLLINSRVECHIQTGSAK